MSTNITEEEWEEIKNSNPNLKWEEKPLKVKKSSTRIPHNETQEYSTPYSSWKHVLLMGLLEAGLWITFIASLLGSFFLLGAGILNESTTQMLLSIPTSIVCVVTGICAKLIHDRNKGGEL